jgi:hypothetical protein
MVLLLDVLICEFLVGVFCCLTWCFWERFAFVFLSLDFYVENFLVSFLMRKFVWGNFDYTVELFVYAIEGTGKNSHKSEVFTRLA